MKKIIKRKRPGAFVGINICSLLRKIKQLSAFVRSVKTGERCEKVCLLAAISLVMSYEKKKLVCQ